MLMLMAGKEKSPAILVYLYLTKIVARLHEPLQEVFNVTDITIRTRNSYFRIVIIFHDVT